MCMSVSLEATLAFTATSASSACPHSQTNTGVSSTRSSVEAREAKEENHPCSLIHGSHVTTRRAAIVTNAARLASTVAATALGRRSAQAAARTEPISAKWTAVDGLPSLDSGDSFVSFESSAYQAMENDASRTPAFREAIVRRLGSNPASQTVLDLGTGPVALFAVMAARAGAGAVYAVEANPAAAAAARECIKKAGYSEVVTVFEGFSTDITLPHKADFCVAEIVGSVASEEGAYATIRDAHVRLLKNPEKDSSWIPSRVQTYAAPASYLLHNALGPPEFDWGKLGGEPVRFNCRDQGLQLLADPLLVEDISFADVLTKEQTARNKKKEVTFTVDSQRIDANTNALYDECRRGQISKPEAEKFATQTSHSLSGIALWPRLVLDEETVVDSRHFGDGSHQKSHWQTVLPIMSARPVGDLQGGEQVRVGIDFTLPTAVRQPASYSIQGTVQS